MPRKGKAILLEAREMSAQYGWTDESIAAVHAARDSGWTLEEIGSVLGCTREFARQLYEREVDPAAEVTGFPVKPKRPKVPRVVSANELRRRLVSDADIEELSALRKVASKRRRNGNPVAVTAAEELYRRVNELVQMGVSPTWLSQQMGLNANTLRFGLIRYGYMTGPPSYQPKRTGGQSA